MKRVLIVDWVSRKKAIYEFSKAREMMSSNERHLVRAINGKNRTIKAEN